MTFVCFFICITLSLFAMVLEGVDWVEWKNLDRWRITLEERDEYSCSSQSYDCVCRNLVTNANKSKPIYARVCLNVLSCFNISALGNITIFISLQTVAKSSLEFIPAMLIILVFIGWENHEFQ